TDAKILRPFTGIAAFGVLGRERPLVLECGAADLLEEIGHAGLAAAVAHGARPFEVKRAGLAAALAALNDPADAARIAPDGPELRLDRHPRNRGWEFAQQRDALIPARRVFGRHTEPDAGFGRGDTECGEQPQEVLGALGENLEDVSASAGRRDHGFPNPREP